MMESYNGKGYKLRKFVSFKDRMKVVDRLVISRNVLMKQSKSWLVSYIIALIEYFTDQLGYQTYKQKLPRLRTKRQKALFQATGIKPKRKTKRKFSRKQLAAQRLFAKRARAGTLRR